MQGNPTFKTLAACIGTGKMFKITRVIAKFMSTIFSLAEPTAVLSEAVSISLDPREFWNYVFGKI